ncbi:MAG: hypothetical protein ACI9HK_001591 [Pirellulaceae bacterium]|jgi:hypothetical protein
MKMFSTILVLLLSIGYLGAQQMRSSVSFPDPVNGYSAAPAAYEDVPPALPVEIVIPDMDLALRRQKVFTISTPAGLMGSDGLRLTGSLNWDSSQGESLVVILEVSRKYKQTVQIMGSVLDILPAEDKDGLFDLVIAIPKNAGDYDLTLSALPIDEEGAPTQDSPIRVAFGNLPLPGK